MSRCWLHPQMAGRLASSPVDTRLERLPSPSSFGSCAWTLPVSALQQELARARAAGPEMRAAPGRLQFRFAVRLPPDFAKSDFAKSAAQERASAPAKAPERNKRYKGKKL